MSSATYNDMYEKYVYQTPTEYVLMLPYNPTSFSRIEEYAKLSSFKLKNPNLSIQTNKDRDYIQASSNDVWNQLGEMSIKEYQYYLNL
jgi:hypothetical protein